MSSEQSEPVRPSPPASAGEWLTRLYDELHEAANRYFQSEPSRHTMQPTAVVHEAYLKLAAMPGQVWESRTSFLAAASVAMRHVLVDYARRRRAMKRGGAARPVPITIADVTDPGDASPPIDVIMMDEAIEKLARVHRRAAQVTELRFFAGVTVEQASRLLGVSVGTVEGDWRFARAWLTSELSRGRDGEPGA